MTSEAMTHASGKELLEDQALVRLTREGDRSAFEVLIRRHQKKILNACYRVVGYSEDARELAADAFAEAYRSLKRFRSEAKFGTWLYRIALNLCFQHLRRKAKERRLMVTGDDETLDRQATNVTSGSSHIVTEALEWEETLGAIRKTLAKISKRHAEMLILCDIEGLSYQEVSQVLCCPVGTVMSRLSRAREEFRQVWNSITED